MWTFFCEMEISAIFQDVIPREGTLLSPLHLTEVCFVPRGLLSPDVPALIKKAYHSCHLYVSSHAVSRPQQNAIIYFSSGKKKGS